MLTNPVQSLGKISVPIFAIKNISMLKDVSLFDKVSLVTYAYRTLEKEDGKATAEIFLTVCDKSVVGLVRTHYLNSDKLP